MMNADQTPSETTAGIPEAAVRGLKSRACAKLGMPRHTSLMPQRPLARHTRPED